MFRDPRVTPRSDKEIYTIHPTSQRWKLLQVIAWVLAWGGAAVCVYGAWIHSNDIAVQYRETWLVMKALLLTTPTVFGLAAAVTGTLLNAFVKYMMRWRHG